MVKQVATKQDVEDLFRRHAGELHGYLFRRAGQPGADLLGDVFVVALQRLDDLPGPELRRAWLFGTARRLLLAEDRRTRKQDRAEHERARLHDHDVTASGGSLSSDQVRSVREALATLREADQELIRLIEWERLEVAEAAAVLGIRPGTARVRLHRARKALLQHPALQAVVGLARVD